MLREFDDESTTPKHMKLYHRTYIIQLIVRLGLECFLSSFSTLLVEASVDGEQDQGHGSERPRQALVPSRLKCIGVLFFVPALNDTFVVSTNQTTVTVVRRDASSGWGMDLNFDCSIVSPSCVKCKFSSKCPFFSCFFCLMLSFSFFFVAFLTLFFFLFYLLKTKTT